MPWKHWSGGRIWIGKYGVPTYHIRLADGRLVSTHLHTEEEALAELFRAGLATGTPQHHPLSDTLIVEYWQDCLARGQDRQCANAKRRHLGEWSRLVRMRRPTLALLNELLPRLDGARAKVASLKAYYTWLRQTGRVRRQDDPTLDLRKPHSRTKDWDRLIPIESHRRAVAELAPRWAAVLTVLLGTGWHVSELLRFARGGLIAGNVLVCPRHKSGEPHRTEVSDEVAAAAQAVRDAGPFSLPLLYREVADACDRAGVPRFGIGGYRHTVATAAVRAGATPEEVAHFLGHKGSYMVKAIYAKTAVPKKVPTLA